MAEGSLPEGVPRPRHEPPPDLAELRAELATLDVEHLPATGPDDRRLASALAFALFFAKRLKKVRFPREVDWARPRFVVVDDKIEVDVAWEPLDGIADLAAVLAEAGERERDAPRPVILALDALDAEATEFELEHALYGEVTLLEFRSRAPAPDARIEGARARGWAATLKEHNLLPGRSLFVESSKLGILPNGGASRSLAGVLLLLPNGHFSMKLNPFAERGDSELQYWLAWGRGSAASEWKDVLYVDD